MKTQAEGLHEWLNRLPELRSCEISIDENAVVWIRNDYDIRVFEPIARAGRLFRYMRINRGRDLQRTTKQYYVSMEKNPS